MNYLIQSSKRVGPLLMLSSCLVLSGCASLQAPPHCPDSRGLACARVDQINQLINHGRLAPLPKPVVISKQILTPQFSSISQHHSAAYHSVKPHWHSAQVMSIWLAPYIDRSGNYHQASVIDARIKPGYWIGPPSVNGLKNKKHKINNKTQ